MVRATWPSTLKVLSDGVDIALLKEWRTHRPEGILVLRKTYPEGPLSDMDGRVTDTINWARPIADQVGKVYLEVPFNEQYQTAPAIADLASATVRAIDRIAEVGMVPVIGIFSEGNPPYMETDWPLFYPALRKARERGGLLGVHEYFTPGCFLDGWHSLRYRKVWAMLPDDCKIPILVTETGIDGGINAPDGNKRAHGWRTYGDAPSYARLLRGYRDQIAQDDYVWAAHVFLCGTYDPGEWTSFDIKDEVDLRGVFSEGVGGPDHLWSPGVAPPPAKPPVSPVMIDWCPFAAKLPISQNYWPDRSGNVPQVIVDHIADGYGSPFGWFNGAAQASSHFWIGKDGQLEQYVPLSGAAWSNGPLDNPDLSVPLIADWNAHGFNPNWASISIEHEGVPGESLTDTQFAVTRKLHEWLSETFNIAWDRHHILGHYQFDSVTRANCPGSKFPWGPLLTLLPPQADDMFDLSPDDKTSVLKIADALWANAEALKAVYAKYGPRGASVGAWLCEAAKAPAVLAKEVGKLNS